jgi:hypothetical protein
MLPTTADRVPANTSECVNEKIHRETEENVARYAHAGPIAIEARLAELDQEWDVERCLETMAPTASLVGLCLGLTVDRKFLAVPIIVQSFLLLHALQGWAPPLVLLRRLSVRTPGEIEHERNALKALRGDYGDLSPLRRDGHAALAAAER